MKYRPARIVAVCIGFAALLFVVFSGTHDTASVDNVAQVANSPILSPNGTTILNPTLSASSTQGTSTEDVSLSHSTSSVNETSFGEPASEGDKTTQSIVGDSPGQLVPYEIQPLVQMPLIEERLDCLSPAARAVFKNVGDCFEEYDMSINLTSP